MLKRKIFFALDRLKISRAERRSVIALIILLFILVLVNALVGTKAGYNGKSYTKIEQIFKKRTAIMKKKNKNLMAAYKGIPVSTAVPDTIPSSSQATSKDTININTASLKLLETLPGIGPVYAQNIIDYRNKHGLFTTSQELLKVRGIGSARLAKIKPYIVLGDIKKVTNIEKEKEVREAIATEKEKAPVKETLININTADAKALENLPGIGEVYAQNIIDYRQRNGSFTTFKQLIKVNGIGEKRLEKLIPLIKLTDEAE